MLRTIVVLVLAGCSASAPSPEPLGSVKDRFDKFIVDHNKRYSPGTAEYRARLKIFGENLARAEALAASSAASSAPADAPHPISAPRLAGALLPSLRSNNAMPAGSPARFGVTRFSDLSPEEFRDRYLSAFRPLARDVGPDATPPSFDAGAPLRAGALNLPLLSTAQPTASVDWRSSLTTPIKNQAQCGSCWAFAAVEAIESQRLRRWWTSLPFAPSSELSVQQIVSCATLPEGTNACTGGNPAFAFAYAQSFGGLEAERDLPYAEADYLREGAADEGRLQRCAADAGRVVDGTGVRAFGWDAALPADEAHMQRVTRDSGPIVAAVDATVWQHYQGGVLTAAQCALSGADGPNHAVNLVGYETSAGGGPGGGPGRGRWIVRNSWGAEWGEAGYLSLELGTDACMVTLQPQRVVLDTVKAPLWAWATVAAGAAAGLIAVGVAGRAWSAWRRGEGSGSRPRDGRAPDRAAPARYEPPWACARCTLVNPGRALACSACRAVR
jgi:hypothetical protein